MRTTALYTSQATQPCFHFLYISLFPLSLSCRSLHSQEVEPLLDFCSGDEEPLRSQKGVHKMLPALFCTHALKDSFPGHPTQQFLKQMEFCSPKAQGPSSAFYEDSILQDHKLHQGRVTTAQAASNRHLSNALLCISEHQVQ